MRLFTRKASKSQLAVRARRQLDRVALNRACSARQSIFEPLENRRMFSVSSVSGVIHIAPIVPVKPIIIQNPDPSSVSITTRYGDELVVTANGPSNSVSVSETSPVLLQTQRMQTAASGLHANVSISTIPPIVLQSQSIQITANGQTFTEAVPAGGLFVYTRGGRDSITINSSVIVQTTVDTIDGAYDTVSNNGQHDIVWSDSSDLVAGGNPVDIHYVSSFAGGVSKAYGASLANPSDSGPTTTANASLFGKGPVIGDVNQGAAADCYFLSGLAGLAQGSPNVIRNSVVDLGDGTYAVEFYKKGVAEFVRVNGQFPAGYFAGGYADAHPGATGNIWAMVMEKAFCYFRKGANTFASINYGDGAEPFNDLGLVLAADSIPSNYSNALLHEVLSNDLADGVAVTFCTYGDAPNLVHNHCYTLTGVEDVGGVLEYTVRNPWGDSGDSLENAQGYATLNYAQLVANFDAMSVA